jgi:REP element-mobilizing transposase RayT
MARRLRIECEGAIWHVTSRGVERRDIYRDRDDRSYFLEMLSEAVVEARWRLHSYVLMSNHYHLLVQTPECTLSQGMKQLNERWADRFNWRHDRVGHLFQGRFHSAPVTDEGHLRELLRYIVLNPVRCGAVESAGAFEWSNYRATAGLAPRPDWLEVDWTLAQFHEDKETARNLYSEFVLEGAKSRRIAPEAVLAAVCTSFSETPQMLHESSRRMGRKAFAQLAREECRLTFREIGAELHVTASAAAQLAAAGCELERSDLRYRIAVANARALAVNGV